ncbi:hypothetical protein [Sphingomonas sp. GC_Shp_3]|uniref:hypothetical protein n=1 Tax=Sphingomonas sp. GC_Shp_3 TaxID=2937383 RepID=UPI00226AE5BD|nr:hypothetical protein [Sphingomonas sp. GC_Shp_3]
MAAPTAPSQGARLRDLGDYLFVLAERYETSERDLTARRDVHDDIERTAGDLRAIVRGTAAKAINPPLETSKDGRRCAW